MPTSPEIIDDLEKGSWLVKRLDKGKLADLATLHETVYGSAIALDYLQKKYDTAYTGIEYTGFLAYNKENAAIAYYGVIPCFLMYNGKVIPAAQSADTMTHPNYRSKGLFGQLSKLTFELCRELGIRLIFGFPNQNFYKAAVNTGWKEIGALDCFVIPLKTVALESIAGRLAILKPAFQSYARHILGKYRLPDPGLPNSLFDEGFGGVLRDDRYLRYKTYSRTSVIEIGRARIWFKIRNGFIIGDLMGLDPNNFPAVMGLIQKIAKRSGVKELQFHASRGTRVHALFAAAYPARPSFPVIFQDFGSGIPLEKIKFTFADIDIF